MKKRLLAAALALCMVFGSAAALPEGVFEARVDHNGECGEHSQPRGKCGENVRWSLKNSVLTISGKGSMSLWLF